jgi:hypothetical protein
MTSLKALLFNTSFPSRVVARSANVAFPCCNLLLLNLSEQLMLIAPFMWLTLYEMKGRQSNTTNSLGPCRAASSLTLSPSGSTVLTFFKTRALCRVALSAQGLVGKLTLGVSSLQRFGGLSVRWPGVGGPGSLKLLFRGSFSPSRGRLLSRHTDMTLVSRVTRYIRGKSSVKPLRPN